MRSSNVLTVLFEEKDLDRMNEKRLKSFKSACYRFVGNRFYCCEFRCEFSLTLN